MGASSEDVGTGGSQPRKIIISEKEGMMKGRKIKWITKSLKRESFIKVVYVKVRTLLGNLERVREILG